jgi:hypothetical protein
MIKVHHKHVWKYCKETPFAQLIDGNENVKKIKNLNYLKN